MPDQLDKMFRPPVVSEYKKQQLVRTRFKWQIFRVGSVVLSVGAALAMVYIPDYQGDPETGEHVFTGVRTRTIEQRTQ